MAIGAASRLPEFKLLEKARSFRVIRKRPKSCQEGEAAKKKTWVGSSWVQILLPVKFTLKNLMLDIGYFSALYTQMKILHVLDV